MGLDLSHLAEKPNFPKSIFPCCYSFSPLSINRLKIDKRTCEVCGDDTAYKFVKEIKSYQLEEVVKIAKSLKVLKQPCSCYALNSHFIKPLNALFVLLTKASRFIHICTYSFDVPMLYALKVLSVSVPIRIIVNESSNKPWLLEEIERSKSFDRNIEIYQVPRDHQKLIVVDGLVAIKGSLNFTTSAWKKLEENKEIIDFETDVTKVRKLNNKFFSPTVKEWRDITNNPYEYADF